MTFIRKTDQQLVDKYTADWFRKKFKREPVLDKFTSEITPDVPWSRIQALIEFYRTSEDDHSDYIMELEGLKEPLKATLEKPVMDGSKWMEDYSKSINPEQYLRKSRDVRIIKASKKTPDVSIHCDGACIPNPGKGGFGAVLVANKITKTFQGFQKKTTNNRMELMAIAKGLEMAQKYYPNKHVVQIVSDSEYALKVIHYKWNPTRHLDLINHIKKMLTTFDDYHLVWVRGHVGDSLNELADKLASGTVIADEVLDISADVC